VLFLVPGIGKKDVHPGQAGRREHLFQHFHRVVLNDAQVRQAGLTDLLEQSTHPRRVHLHPQEIQLRPSLRDLRGGRAHAETDLEHGRRVAAEGPWQVDRCSLKGQQVERPEFFHGALLPGAHAPGSQHETADAAPLRKVCLRLR